MTTKGKILLVDDEKELRNCIAELLEDEGYKVVQAENGLVALERLKNMNLPCMIMLDYMMPLMDGRTFCEMIKKDPAYNAIPIILLSAASIPNEVISQMDNVTVKLEKPININLFLSVAEKFCHCP